jgi:conjugal transfer/entry exclusion protein
MYLLLFQDLKVSSWMSASEAVAARAQFNEIKKSVQHDMDSMKSYLSEAGSTLMEYMQKSSEADEEKQKDLHEKLIGALMSTEEMRQDFYENERKNAKLEEKLLSLQEENAERLNKLQAAHQLEIDEKDRAFSIAEGAHQSTLASLNIAHEKVVTDLKGSHKMELDGLVVNHTNVVNQLKKELVDLGNSKRFADPNLFCLVLTRTLIFPLASV